MVRKLDKYKQGLNSMAENSTENYNQLLKRKEELTKEYGKLNQILGGKEEPENAKKIGELNMQKTLLKDELISLGTTSSNFLEEN